MATHRRAFILPLLLAAASLLADNSSEDLVQKKFQPQMDRLNSDGEKKVKAIQKAMLSEYDVVIKKLLQAGKLEEANSVKSQMDALKELAVSAALKEGAAADDPVRKRYVEQLSAAKLEYDKRMEAIQKSMIAEYESAMKRAMQAGKLEEANALKTKIESLKEPSSAPAEEPAPQKMKEPSLSLQEMLDAQTAKARQRMQADIRQYSKEEIALIENLYKEASQKRDPSDAKDALKTMLDKYPKANRTGCVLISLAQRSKGGERMKYLQQAINDFGDCYYGDGVQVASIARYLLAKACAEGGDKRKAKRLVEEIYAGFPDSVTHQGDSLIAVIERDSDLPKPGTK